MEDINRLSLNDEVKVEDKLSPKGLVIVRDIDGNIIFKGNNMVVKHGRNLLLNLFLGTANTEKFANIKAFIGDNSTMTAANDGYSGYTPITSGAPVEVPTAESYKRRNSEGSGLTTIDPADPDDFMIYYNGANNTRLCPNANTLYYIVNDEKLYIHMGINYTPAQPITASTFGLFFKNANDGLFSRIVFPKRTLGSGSPLIIDYYLYF